MTPNVLPGKNCPTNGVIRDHKKESFSALSFEFNR